MIDVKRWSCEGLSEAKDWKVCKSCGQEFPTEFVVDGERRILKGFDACFDCFYLNSILKKMMDNGEIVCEKDGSVISFHEMTRLTNAGEDFVIVSLRGTGQGEGD